MASIRPHVPANQLLLPVRNQRQGIRPLYHTPTLYSCKHLWVLAGTHKNTLQARNQRQSICTLAVSHPSTHANTFVYLQLHKSPYRQQQHKNLQQGICPLYHTPTVYSCTFVSTSVSRHNAHVHSVGTTEPTTRHPLIIAPLHCCLGCY